MDSFSEQWQRWFPEDKEQKPPPKGAKNQAGNLVVWLLAGALALFMP